MSQLTDDQIITRMRTALDELTADVAADDDTVVSVRPAALRPERRAAWLGVAATTALLAGGALWALSARSDDPVAGPATTVPAASTTTTTVGAEPPRDAPAFTIISARLAPGPATAETVQEASDALLQVWRVQGEGLDGLLMASVLTQSPFDQETAAGWTFTDLSGFPDGDARLLTPPVPADDILAEPLIEWIRSDGTIWFFEEVGLAPAGSVDAWDDSWVDVVRSAVPGSGLPIVVTDERATSIGASGASTTFVRQEFTGVDGETVSLGLTDSLGWFSGLFGETGVEPVTIAGRPGWRVALAGEAVTAIWDAGDGWYGQLTIPYPLSANADDIIASVVRTDDAPPGTTVATPETEQLYEVLGTIVELPAGTFAIEVPTPDQSVIQLELRDFSWEAVSIERSALDGVMRSEPGAFTVRDYQDRSVAFVDVQVLDGLAEPLDPCVFDQEVLPLDELNALDQRALDIAGYQAALNGDGTCDRIVLLVFVDSVALRDAIAPIADALEVRPLLTPL